MNEKMNLDVRFIHSIYYYIRIIYY